MIKYGISYMGCKRRIAEQLLTKMLETKPNAKYFYDLFGGGGAMSFMALQFGLKVVYNEKHTFMSYFMQFIINRIKEEKKGKYGILPDEYYNFISRDKFNELLKKDLIYSQFAKIIYSFGNNQKGYLFSKELEKKKRLIHDSAVFNCQKSLLSFNKLIEVNIKLSNKKDYNSRRLEVMQQVKFQYKRFDLEQLERIQHLERLQNLKQVSNLKILNKDFQDVEILENPDETIVYLDPPYRNTATYLESALHKDIDNYLKNSKYTCFMSEYEAPFKSILDIKKVCSLSAVNNNKKTTEKLFINK